MRGCGRCPVYTAHCQRCRSVRAEAFEALGIRLTRVGKDALARRAFTKALRIRMGYRV